MINHGRTPVSRQPSANLNPVIAKGGSSLKSKIASAVPASFKDGNGRCVSTGLKRTADGVAKQTICCVDGRSGKKTCRDRVYPYAASLRQDAGLVGRSGPEEPPRAPRGLDQAGMQPLNMSLQALP